MAKRKTKSQSSKKNKSFSIFIIVVIILALLSFAISYFVMQTESEIVTTSTNRENKKPLQKPVRKSNLKIIQEKSVLEGTWASYSDGAMLTIKGKYFSIELPSVESTILASGKVSVKDNVVTFIYTNKGSDCMSKPGLYKFKIQGDDVTFVMEKDGCMSRVGMIAATWFKV